MSQLWESIARSRKYCIVVTIITYIYGYNVQSTLFHIFEFPNLKNRLIHDSSNPTFDKKAMKLFFIFLLLFLHIFAIALNLSRCCCLRASYFLRSAFFIRKSRNLQRIFSERPVLRRSNSSSILLQLITFSKCLPKFWKYINTYS